MTQKQYQVHSDSENVNVPALNKESHLQQTLEDIVDPNRDTVLEHTNMNIASEQVSDLYPGNVPQHNYGSSSDNVFENASGFSEGFHKSNLSRESSVSLNSSESNFDSEDSFSLELSSAIDEDEEEQASKELASLSTATSDECSERQINIELLSRINALVSHPETHVVKFERDCLRERNLISSHDLELKTGDGEFEFRAWKQETRLNCMEIISCSKDLAALISRYVPGDCITANVPLYEQIQRNEFIWSEITVQILLTWIRLRGYCFFRNEKEFLTTKRAVDEILNHTERRNTVEDNAYDGQMRLIVELNGKFREHEDYLAELLESGRNHMPLERKFRVNDILWDATVDKIERGDYGYAFLSLCSVPNRHGVPLDGLHFFQHGYVFCSGISFAVQYLHEKDCFKKKDSKYYGYNQLPFRPCGLKEGSANIFRLVFTTNKEEEIRSAYALLSHLHRVTKNATDKSYSFFSEIRGSENFQLKVLIPATTMKEITKCFKTKETSGKDLSSEDDKVYFQCRGSLDELAIITEKILSSDKICNMEASLVVSNPSRSTFCAIYASVNVIGFVSDSNALVVCESLAGMADVIKKGATNCLNFDWRKNNSPRSLIELVTCKNWTGSIPDFNFVDVVH